ncbi:MAG: carbohydrate kinase [Pelolinea sp.]|jgi:sugar (pentulose or hexulose) kinase|nr:carbohydrate kinase [Pelolinea sp.]
MSGEFLLTIDNGTQSVRVLVFDLQGNLVAKSKVDIVPYVSPENGWAEQDPEYFWIKLCEACQKLWKENKIDKTAIAGLSITTQRCTVINLDQNGKPLRPAIVWLDQRRTSNVEPVHGLWGTLLKASGMGETVRYLQSEAEVNWIRRYQPEIWKQTHKFVFLSGYLVYKFTGQFKDSVGSQVGYLPFDYKKQTWCGKSDWKWQAVPVEKEKLVDLVKPTDRLGEVSHQAALETGIPEGLPIIAAAADKACEVIGSGCLDPHIGCLSFGTTATINTTHKDYVEVIPLIPPYPSAVPGAYSLEIQIYRGFWMVSWFKNEFAENEQRVAKNRGVEVEELFDDLVASVPPGSLGLTLQPYWSPGLKEPGPEAKGAIIGFGDVHTRAHVYRSILEGLGYSLREGAERTTKRTKIPITEVRIAGGGSQSPAATQLTADIFGLPAAKPHTYEASGLGAAIDLAVGLKLHPDFDTAVFNMTRIGETFEPNMQNHRIYDELYQRVYCKMYKLLKPLYEEIRDITGYPAD